MQSHLDQLIQRFEQITQQLKVLELVFTQSRKQHCADVTAPMICAEAKSNAPSLTETSVD
jgi:hypothetical protein